MRCECCGHPITDAATAVGAKLDDLRAACEAAGIVVSFDGYVREADAALLLGLSPYTLRNRRLEDAPLPARKLGRSWEYSLQELARFLVECT